MAKSDNDADRIYLNRHTPEYPGKRGKDDPEYKKPVSREHELQNEIRNDLAGECLLFRANVGSGWQGAGKPERYSKPTTVVINRGDVVLRKARPFDTGLPAGFSDLFGVTSITITPEMVGKRVGVFFAMEVKDKAQASREQANFLQAVKDNGGIAGIAKSTEDARKIVRKKKHGD